VHGALVLEWQRGSQQRQTGDVTESGLGRQRGGQFRCAVHLAGVDMGGRFAAMVVGGDQVVVVGGSPETVDPTVPLSFSPLWRGGRVASVGWGPGPEMSDKSDYAGLGVDLDGAPVGDAGGGVGGPDERGDAKIAGHDRRVAHRSTFLDHQGPHDGEERVE
jgi:hypothetical protein